MITQAAVERRQEPRISLEDNAKIHILRPREHPDGRVSSSTLEGYLLDLNSFGAFVATDLDLRKGLTINMIIDLPGMKNPERVPAFVARRAEKIQRYDQITPEGLGLRFIAESVKDQAHIRRIVLMILTLDLLKYGYENRRTIRFWREVFANSPLSNSDLETDLSLRKSNPANTQIFISDSEGQNLLETYSKEQAGLSSQKFPE